MKRFKSSVDIDGALTVGGQPVVGGGGAGAIATNIVDAKGDLIVGSAVDTVARLAAGTNGQVLSADSTEITGLKWVDANFTGGSGSGDPTVVAEGVYSSVNNLTQDTVFTSTYNDYRLVLYISGGSATDSIMFRYRSSGIDESAAVYSNGVVYARGTSGYGATAASETSSQITSIYSGYVSYVDAVISAPNLAEPTYRVDSSHERTATTPYTNHKTSLLSTATQYDGFKIYTAGGATISGFYRLYGIPKTTAGSASASSVSNLFHNPAFEMWQRGTSSTSCPAGSRTFLADRWFVRPTGAAVTQQQSSTVPSGSFARYALQIDGAASVTTIDVSQRVEAANIPALARTITFSWRVYNGTGASFTPNLLLGTPAASDDFTTVTNRLTQSLQACTDATWTTVSHTINISGYTNLANGVEIALQFPSGSVVAGDTIRITEAQVTASSGVVGFNRPDQNTDRKACEWYYWRRGGQATYQTLATGGIAGTTTTGRFTMPFSMRKQPQFSYSSLRCVDAFAHVVSNIASDITIYGNAGPVTFDVTTTGLVQGRSCWLDTDNNLAGFLALDAEL